MQFVAGCAVPLIGEADLSLQCSTLRTAPYSLPRSLKSHVTNEKTPIVAAVNLDTLYTKPESIEFIVQSRAMRLTPTIF